MLSPYKFFYQGKNAFYIIFFIQSTIASQSFSVLPWQFHRHIDLVVDFFNLGLAKFLWPQDAVLTLYVGLSLIASKEKVQL